MIKNKLLLMAIIAASFLLPAAAVRAQGISIHIGDRPYYSHGPHYWAGDYQMIWVSGHMTRQGRWIHGRYVRGEHRRDWDRRHSSDRHRDGYRRHDNRYDNDRRDDYRR